jgi:hypothetical protein
MADKKISALTAATLPLAGTEVLPIVQGSTTVKVTTDDLTVKNVRSNATTGILQVTGPATGTTRVMTTPNANFTAARTDATQTFTGLQLFSNGGNENIRLSDGTANSTLQQNSANLYFNVNDTAATNGAFFWRSSNSLTTVMTLNGATGDLTANTGNVVIGTAGKGIDFSANSHAAGMTSELLNWYEEGVWTPTVSSDSGSITSYTATGTYTRVGRSVALNFDIQITNNGTGATAITLVSLPFAAKSTYAATGVFREVAATGNVGAVTIGSTTSMSLNTYNNQYPGGTNYRIIGSITYPV